MNALRGWFSTAALWQRAKIAARLPVQQSETTVECMVEAAGVEPASGNASERTSTRVGSLFRVSRSPAAADLRAQQANFVSTSMRRRVRRPSLIVSVLSSYRRKSGAPSLTWLIRQREQQRYRSQLHGLPIFTWPWAPRRAIRTSTSPSKPVRPHVKEPLHYGHGEGVGQAGVFPTSYSGSATPEPPIFSGTSFIFGRPSLMRMTVSW